MAALEEKIDDRLSQGDKPSHRGHCYEKQQPQCKGKIFSQPFEISLHRMFDNAGRTAMPIATPNILWETVSASLNKTDR